MKRYTNTHDFKKLKVWQKARLLVPEIYQLTESFPDSEKYGLTSQTRRACTSICMNIAEGCGRHTNKAFANYLDNAYASASELTAALMIAMDLNYINKDSLRRVFSSVDEIQRMLNPLIRKNLEEPMSHYSNLTTHYSSQSEKQASLRTKN